MLLSRVRSPQSKDIPIVTLLITVLVSTREIPMNLQVLELRMLNRTLGSRWFTYVNVVRCMEAAVSFCVVRRVLKIWEGSGVGGGRRGGGGG